jgi:glycosyltransferase involved in cell wall biosynthesis
MISVIIPTLNHERALPRCFDSLIPAAVRGVVREVIVADGGSSDGTLAIADAAGAHVVTTAEFSSCGAKRLTGGDGEAGRGEKGLRHFGAGQPAQPEGVTRSERLNAGAAMAKGDWLLFLHPETALEPGWDQDVESFLAQEFVERPRAACFRFGLEGFGGEVRRDEAKANLRTWLLGLPYGDQGLLIPKRLYRQLGGYRALARMEDADLVRRIGRRRLIALRSRAINLSRPRAGSIRGALLSLLHMLRVPASVVAKL